MKRYEKTTYDISKLVTKNYSTSFFSASLIFSSNIRKAIFSIYGFVRFADEIVDTFHDYNKGELLDKFKADFKTDFKIGLSLNPILHSFILTIKKYNIEMELIESFLRSMHNDLTISKYITTENINEYIYGSAEVVGLMCLSVFCNGDKQQYNELKNEARILGAAFQKINFLRDLNEDLFTLNRSYFPQIKENIFDEEQKNLIIEDIEKDFNNSLKGIKKLPKDAKTGVYIAFLYYKQLLKKTKRTSAKKILNKRIRVHNFIKFCIIIKGVIVIKLNLIK